MKRWPVSFLFTVFAVTGVLLTADAEADEYGAPLWAVTNDRNETEGWGYHELLAGNAVSWGESIYVDGQVFRVSAKVSRSEDAGPQGVGGMLVADILDPQNGYQRLGFAAMGAPGWTEPGWLYTMNDIVLPQPIKGVYIFTIRNSLLGTTSPKIWHDSGPPNGGLKWDNVTQTWTRGHMDPLIRVEVNITPDNLPPCADQGGHPTADAHYYEDTLKDGSATVTLATSFNNMCDDPDNDSLTYYWQCTCDPQGTDVRYGTSVNITYNAAGVRYWRLYVTDGQHTLLDPELVEVNILEPSPGNKRPKAQITQRPPERFHASDPDYKTFVLGGVGTDDDIGDTIVVCEWTDVHNNIVTIEENPEKVGWQYVSEYTVDFTKYPARPFPYTFSFRVQDNHRAWSDPVHVSVYRSPLPVIRYFSARADWLNNGEPFDFTTTHSVRLENQDVEISSVSLHLRKTRVHGGSGLVKCDELSFNPEVDKTVTGPWSPGFNGEVALLAADGKYAWDIGDCDVTYHLLPWCDEQGAVDLESGLWADVTDANHYSFRLPVRGNKKQTYRLSVTQEKMDALEHAMFVRNAGRIIGTLVGFVFGFPGGGTIGGRVGTAIDEYKGWCRTAHDPPAPDPDYQTKVNIEYLSGTWQPSCDASLDDAVEMSRQARRIHAIHNAYRGARAKLYGAYVYHGDTASIVLQGTDNIRYARMLQDALKALANTHPGLVDLMSRLSVGDLEAFQQEVEQYGLPSWFSESFTNYGFDPQIADEFEELIVNMDPSTALYEAARDPMPTVESLSHVLEGQSYFDAPGGFLLAAIISPEDKSPVSGTVTIDARIVDKRDYSCWAACGKPRVTNVWIDNVPVAQGVPFVWNTLLLPDGAHTVTIKATDNCPGACPHNVAFDNVTVTVDNTSPTIATDLTDIDPQSPGIQIESGTEVAWTMDDPAAGGVSSGIVGLDNGSRRYYRTGDTSLTVCTRDYAGNHVAESETFSVIPGYEPLAGFQLTRMAFRFAETRRGKEEDDQFRIEGELTLPDDCRESDLRTEVRLILEAADGLDSGEDTVGLTRGRGEWKYRPKKEKKIPEDTTGIAVTEMKVRWTRLHKGEKAHTAEFEIQGDMFLNLTHVSRPPSAYVAFILTTNKGEKIGGADVFDLTPKKKRWWGRRRLTPSGPMTFNHARPVPAAFGLSQNYPNPVSNTTTIEYAIPSDCHVTLQVYNTAGRKVMTLVDDDQSPGYRAAAVDAKKMAAGIYFYRLEAGDFRTSRKMIVLR